MESSIPERQWIVGVREKLPTELMAMIQQYFADQAEAMPMTVKEATDHMIKLMKDRDAFVKGAEQGWQQHSYNFCEH